MADRIQDSVNRAEFAANEVQEHLSLIESENLSVRAVLSRVRELAEDIHRNPEDVTAVETAAQEIIERVDSLG